MIRLAVGIDPGLKGGLAVISSDYNKLIDCIPMPIVNGRLDVEGVIEFFYPFAPSMTQVFIEKAQAMPKQGVVSMFNYGKGVGILHGIVLGFGYTLTEVRPQEWKAYVHPDRKHRTKDDTIAWAELTYEADLIPLGKKKPQDGMADAIAIAHYGSRAHA